MKIRGQSAVEAAIELARDLESWAHMPKRKVHPLLGPASVNIGRIEGGIQATSVASDCRMEVCFTYHPEDEHLLLDETDAIVADWRARQSPRSRLTSENSITSSPSPQIPTLIGSRC